MKFSVQLRAARPADELPDITQIVEAASGTEAAARALRPDYAVRLVTAAPAETVAVAAPQASEKAPSPASPSATSIAPTRQRARAATAPARAALRKAVRP